MQTAHHTITGKRRIGVFDDVNLAPGLTTSMISAGKLCDDGRNILLTDKAAYILPSDLHKPHR